MWDVIFGTLFVLALVFLAMAMWGRMVAKRHEEPTDVRPGNSVVPKAKDS